MRKPTGSQYLVIRQWKKVVTDAIPRLSSPAAAELLESEIYRARCGGMISDKEYYNFSQAIKEMYKINDWAMPE